MKRDPLARVRAHPRVAKAWAEGNTDGGGSDVWAELVPGWVYEECHTVHEYSVAAVLAALGSLTPCDCDGCTEDQKGTP